MTGTALALLANRLQVTEAEVKQSLTATVFKGANDAQMTALLVVANEYGLNPFTRELYAFPSRAGIVPVVSVDGWLRIINEHPQFAGMSIVYAEKVVTVEKSRPCPEYIEVTIRRKDRPGTSTPIREYLDECYRNTDPWNGMTRRMLRHKAIKEAARVTMGLHGIFDIDEASDVLEREGKHIVATGEAYEVVEEDSGQLIDETQHATLLAEMERTGLSQDSVRKNLSLKAGYSGELADMPLTVFDALMRGLATMPDKTPPPTPQSATSSTEMAPHGDASVSGATDTPAGVSDAEAEDSYWPDVDADEVSMDAAAAAAFTEEVGQANARFSETTEEAPGGITTQQMRALNVQWRKLLDAGWSDEQLHRLLEKVTGKVSRKALTIGEASGFIKTLALEVQDLGTEVAP